jgi:myosin V
MLAAVLWFGNISFTVIDNENHVQAVENEGKKFTEPLLNECMLLLSFLELSPKPSKNLL